MFKRILVPLDGSQRVEQAIALALPLAKACGASLLLLEAVSPPTDPSLHSARALSHLHAMHEKRMVTTTAYLAQLARSLEGKGIEVGLVVLSGQPAQTILNVASEQDIDLIVLCSHGRTGFSRWSLGSTSQKVVRQSTVPVLLLRDQRPKTPGRMTSPFRATVALDGSSFAEAALLPTAHLVAALSAPGEGELHLLQLVEVPAIEEEFGYLPDANLHFSHRALQEAGNYLQTVYTRLLRVSPELARLRISWSVEECRDVADALIQIAESGKGISMCQASQLIALTTHGRSGLHRWLLGSVTERIIHGSPLPLLIVHPSKTIPLSMMEEDEKSEREEHEESIYAYKEKKDVPDYSCPS